MQNLHETQISISLDGKSSGPCTRAVAELWSLGRSHRVRLACRLQLSEPNNWDSRSGFFTFPLTKLGRLRSTVEKRGPLGSRIIDSSRFASVKYLLSSKHIKAGRILLLFFCSAILQSFHAPTSVILFVILSESFSTISK